MQLRPGVQAFAEAMETKLRKHDNLKGERGWIEDTSGDLLAAAWGHAGKLQKRWASGKGTLLSDAADVANLLMMACDVDGVLPDGVSP